MSVQPLLKSAAAQLQAAGIDEPLREARLLLAAAMNVANLAQAACAPTPDEAQTFETMIARRAAREPVAYILGRKEFWSLDFEVTPATLIPRPETETVIEAALAAFKGRPPPRRILDLGTGSGCLLIAALTEFPAATGLGIDKSPDALAVAERNARRLGVATRAQFRHGDWTQGLAERFDLVLSNPPYISDAEIAMLERDVAAYEPAGALKGGADGLDPLRRIAQGLKNVLDREAVALVEIGADQAAAAGRILVNAGLEFVKAIKDLGGRDRVVVARLPHAAGV